MNEATKQDWHREAAALSFDTDPFVDGQRLGLTSSATFDTANPATGRMLAAFPDADEAAVDRAVLAARAAFPAWRDLSPVARSRLLGDIADAVRNNAARLALFDTLEMGKPITLSQGEAEAAADFLQYYAELADKIEGELACTPRLNGLSMTYLEPRGVVGVITPWNFPLLTAVSAIGPALAAGNCVVQKPSEVSPSSALLLAELASQCGLPPGVLNVVPGTGGSAGAALARHADVDKLHFTGSTAVGMQLMIYAGESNGKPVMLETGGKSPQIVFSDAADIDGLGAALARDVFSNSGQICVARTRLLVHESVAHAVVERIATECESVFTVGDTLDSQVNYGPICSERQYNRVMAYTQAAGEQGVSLRSAGIRGTAPNNGYYVMPTLAEGVKPTMALAREEVFGPVLSVMTFRDEDEAVALANDTAYGLAATAWTRDMARAHRLSRVINAGRVDLRSAATPGASLAHLSAEPFGASGHGVLGGRRGLEPYLRHKGVQFLTG